MAFDGMVVFCLSVVVMVELGIVRLVVVMLGHRISVDPIEICTEISLKVCINLIC